MDMAIAGSAFLFEGWRFDPIQPALSRRDPSGAWRTVSISSRALGILGLLLEQRGEVVPRDRIIEAIWPTTTVEPNNLAVQIAGLRRVLDGGRQGESLIQTIQGQGYRFAGSVEMETGFATMTDRSEDPVARDSKATARSRRHPRTFLVGIVFIAMLTTIAAWWSIGRNGAPAIRPASVVIVAFSDMSDTETFSPLARALTENVASDLARFHLFGVPHAVVIASGLAARDPALIRTHDALYALCGSLHQLDGTITLDVQLIDTQTGTQLWWQRFDVGPGGTADTQRNAVRRIVFGAGPAILTAEIQRRRQKRTNDPTATDLMLQARLILQQPPNRERLIRARDLFEQALQLEPSSVILKGQLVTELMDSEDFSPSGFKSVLERTRALVADILMEIPNSQMALRVDGQWLIWQNGRCPEAIEAARKLADMYPEVQQADRWLGRCLVLTGRAEEALPWLERAVRVGGVSDPGQFSSFRALGEALLDLGRFKEAIEWLQRGFAVNPDESTESQSWRLSRIAIAQALDGDVADARQTMAHAQALSPYLTVRGEKHFEAGTPGLARIRRLQEGLRLAGARDHADEEADFGVAPIAALQQATTGHTSMIVAGATTVRTVEVVKLLATGKALIIDTMSRSLGPSLPSAVGLQYVGAGGSLSDLAQDRLRQVMRELTKGDLTRPVLAFGWNSESFDGVNLALRLVALGYRNVLWYRGGHEAWEASGGTEVSLAVRDW